MIIVYIAYVWNRSIAKSADKSSFSICPHAGSALVSVRDAHSRGRPSCMITAPKLLNCCPPAGRSAYVDQSRLVSVLCIATVSATHALPVASKNRFPVASILELVLLLHWNSDKIWLDIVQIPGDAELPYGQLVVAFSSGLISFGCPVGRQFLSVGDRRMSLTVDSAASCLCLIFCLFLCIAIIMRVDFRYGPSSLRRQCYRYTINKTILSHYMPLRPDRASFRRAVKISGETLRPKHKRSKWYQPNSVSVVVRRLDSSVNSMCQNAFFMFIDCWAHGPSITSEVRLQLYSWNN